jgi:Ca-activated chloride channel homolog
LALYLPAGSRTVELMVRRIGYTPQNLRVSVNGSSATLNVALVTAPMRLESVVVNSAPTSSRPREGKARDVIVVQSTNPATPAASLPASISVAGAATTVSQGYVGQPMVLSRADREMRRAAGVHDSANRVQYANLVENPFLTALRTPLSTFAIDVDRASYSDVRHYLDAGSRPPRDAVRLEELVNYFHYDYHAPAKGAAPLDVTVETHAAPWQPSHRLIRIGMQAQRLPIADLPPANLVFLIDVSGSMYAANKLPLVIKSLRLLTAELRAQDRVAIAVYAGAAGLVLPSTPGSDKSRIFDALDRLQAGGSTNGGAGIRLAYQTARDHFISEGANRVILATDGDFNVGTTSDSDLIQLIEHERASGVFLTVLGVGEANTQHAKMEQLADKGNGQYAYIDDIAEAQKALVREMGGTLFTLAKDVKIQVEFNPSRVRSYRLLGYENRLLRDEDFNDDTKDAGELGAGHSVTALYEVELTTAAATAVTGSVDPLRYGSREPAPSSHASGDELAFVKVRYQPPQGGTSALLTWAVRESDTAPTVDYLFASAVAGFGLLLRDSPHKGNLTWSDVRRMGERGLGADAEGDRAGFLRLVNTAERVMSTTARVDLPR